MDTLKDKQLIYELTNVPYQFLVKNLISFSKGFDTSHKRLHISIPNGARLLKKCLGIRQREGKMKEDSLGRLEKLILGDIRGH